MIGDSELMGERESEKGEILIGVDDSGSDWREEMFGDSGLVGDRGCGKREGEREVLIGVDGVGVGEWVREREGEGGKV